MITARDISVLKTIASYYVLSRQQVQRVCFPDDPNGRITRRRLQTLVSDGFINRHRLFVLNSVQGAPAPVYYPTQKGTHFLAEQFDDERFLRVNTDCPQAHLLDHWISISNTHIALDQAIAAQTGVCLDGWCNEWEVVNKDESVPEKRFRIYTLVRSEPRLVCAPDAAFLLSKNGFRKVFFLEQDRNTTGVERAIQSKTPGYAGMAERNLHLRLFPDANVPSFTVLMVAPTPRRREALRKALRDKNLPSANLWKFVAACDFTPESFLSGPIFYPCAGDPAPLIKTNPTAQFSADSANAKDPGAK